MKINEQIVQAKKFTDKLLKQLVLTNGILNKDGSGCWVTSIHISYMTDRVELEVGFRSNNSDVESFFCKSEKR